MAKNNGLIMVVSLLFVLFFTSIVQAGEIHKAVISGDLARTEQLLNANPKLVNEKDKNGQTPLHLAVAKDNKETVLLLLAKGADVKASDNKGETPLSLALKRKNKDVLTLLFEKGANFNVIVKDKNGLKEYRKILVLLLEKAPDCSIKLQMEAYQSAVSPTKSTGIQKGKEKRTKIESHPKANTYYKLSIVLKRHKDIKELMFNHRIKGSTPLHLAVMRNNQNLVRQLLDKGADINAKDKNGWAPLQLAILNGHNEIATLLLEKGANVNIK